MRRLSAAVLILAMSSFTNDREIPCESPPLHRNSPFPVGVAVDVEKLARDERYRLTAATHFSSFTPEKILKPAFVHPKSDHFDFSSADVLIEFCRANNIRLHGHALIWHRELPRWIEKFRGSADEWDLLLKTHVQTIVGHCRPVIASWDVVNEAFNDDGTLRGNVWLEHLGPSYLEKAFRYAQEANPDALLFYNDYALEQGGQKLEAVLDHLEGLRRAGVRVDGIGMQMHVTLDAPGSATIDLAAAAIAGRGFLVHYSEVDVSLADRSLFEPGKALAFAQKERIKEIVEGYLRLPPGKRFGITVWGVGDHDSWLAEKHMRARPLLFDKRYRPKPAFCGFSEALAGETGTQHH